MFDLIVVGGGPAGCAAAITAAREGGSVLLLERGGYPRQKVCGEFVSAESIETLSDLLGESRELVLDAPRITAGRMFLDNSIIRIPIAPTAISIPRFHLDLALWRAATAAGVDARQRITVMAIQEAVGENGASFRVVSSVGVFEARTVVDATGRWSNLMARRTKLLAGPKWVGLKGHFAADSIPGSVDMYFFPGGYCGVQPVGDGVLNACAMVRADVAKDLPEVFARCPALLARSRYWQPSTAEASTSPLVFRKPVASAGRIVFVGDAAGFIDPFAGDGISLALRGGVAAAEALSLVWKQKLPLADAVALYRTQYEHRFVPAFRNAARVRRIFTLPRPVRRFAAMVAKVPGVADVFLKMTRAA